MRNLFAAKSLLSAVLSFGDWSRRRRFTPGGLHVFTAPICFLLSVLLLWFGTTAKGQDLGEPVTVQWVTISNLLNWSATNDVNARYNRSSVPLAARISNPALNVNSHARTNEARVMALVSFNSYSTGSAEGPHTTSYYPFNYWGYADSMTFWGSSDNDHGLIMTPAGHVVDAAHRNGVKIYGKVFFGPTVFGGNIQNVNTFLQKSGTNFPVADKMIEAARYFGFDGWFLNQETEGGNATTAANMRDFISYFKAQAPDLQIVWYDAMNESGSVGWQGAFDSANDWFMYYIGAKVADTMFIDFRWSSSSLANSRSLALSYGLDPYDFYTGVDAGPAGYNTTVSWTSFFPEGQTNLLSLGLFGSEWVYKTATSTTDMHARDNRFWVGPSGDPSNTSSTNSWPGIAHFTPASSPVSSVPFGTCFNPGQGTNFNINGQRLMAGPWSNLGLQDVLPTWRWLLKTTNTTTRLNAGLDFSDSYYGSACLLVNGTMAGTNDLWLYETSLAVSNNTQFRIVYKSGAIGASNVRLALAFEDNPVAFQFLDVSNTVTTGWNTNVLDLGSFAGKKIAVIALRFGATGSTSYNMRIGQLAVYHGALSAPVPPTDIQLDQPYNLDWKTYNLRLTWSNSTDTVYYYNVYRRNPDNSLRWLWATPNNGVFISQLARSNNEVFTPIEIEAVGPDFGASTHAVYNFQWIDPIAIPLTNSDALGFSSFNSGLNWSNGFAPAATNIYLVSSLGLRTPATNADQTFAGGALVLTNGATLVIKAAGNNYVTTIGAAPGTGMFAGNAVISDASGQDQTLAGYITLGSGGVLFDPQNSTLTVSSAILGTGSLTVDTVAPPSTGKVILSGANAYSGNTILNSSNTLQLANSSALGLGASSVIFSNTATHGFGTLDLNGTGPSVNNLSGTGGTILNNSGSGNATFTIGTSNGSGGIFQGRIIDNTTGSGTVTLVKAGTGAITLSSNTNKVSGGLNVSGGTLTVNNSGALSVGNGSSASIGIASSSLSAGTQTATLDVSTSTNFTANVGTFQVGTTTASGGNPVIIGTLKLGTNNNITASTSVVFGDMGNAFNINVQPVNTPANGVTTILTPSLTIAGSKASTTFTLGGGARLNLGASGNRTALGVAVSPQGGSGSYTGTADFSGGIFNGFLSNLTIGSLNNGGAGNETGTMTVSANASNHLDISGSGNVVTLGKYLGGSGAGVVSGALTINNIDSTSAITSSDNSIAVLLGSTAKSSGTLNLNGGTLTIKTTNSAIAGGLGASTLMLNGVTLTAATNSPVFITNLTTATLNPGGVTFDTGGFNITVAQLLANGGGGLTKMGVGKLTLSKANTYSGNTTIAAGTLALAEPGSIANSATITISNNATLDVLGRTDQTLTLSNAKNLKGGGTIAGKLTALAGSTINPGDGIGVLTVQSNVILNGLLVMELNDAAVQTSDRLSAGGTISGGGTLTVSNLGPALQLNDTFQLFNKAVGGFATINLPDVTPNVWTNMLGADGTIKIVFPIATNSTNITIQLIDTNLALSWPNDHTGWRLQSSTNLLGTNWSDVPDAASTNQVVVPVDLNNSGLFFRLIYP